MDAPARPRSTRDRPAKAPLSGEAVVEAALAITRAEGLEAVTMRRVAAELDTGAASLYVYVANRDELVRAMLNRVLGSIPRVAPDPSRWREQLHELLGRFREVLEAHPGLSATMTGEPPISESALAGIETLLGLLLAGGIAIQDAAWACDILGLIVTATATEADVRRAAGRNSEADRLDATLRMHHAFTGLSAERHPLIVTHADALVAGEGDERFRFSIDTFLDGLVARASRG